jgi:hypothetical protein
VAEIELAYPEPRPSKQLPIAVGSGPHASTSGRVSGEASPPARLSGQAAPAPRMSRPVAAAAPPVEIVMDETPAPTPVTRHMLADPRVRLGIAVAAGLLCGFLSAQLYASGAEDRLDEIRLELLHEPVAQTTDEYQQAVERHELARGRMERTKRRIELAAGFLWIAIGGGVGYAAYRFMPTNP